MAIIRRKRPGFRKMKKNIQQLLLRYQYVTATSDWHYDDRSYKRNECDEWIGYEDRNSLLSASLYSDGGNNYLFRIYEFNKETGREEETDYVTLDKNLQQRYRRRGRLRPALTSMT